LAAKKALLDKRLQDVQTTLQGGAAGKASKTAAPAPAQSAVAQPGEFISPISQLLPASLSNSQLLPPTLYSVGALSRSTAAAGSASRLSDSSSSSNSEESSSDSSSSDSDSDSSDEESETG